MSYSIEIKSYVDGYSIVTKFNTKQMKQFRNYLILISGKTNYKSYITIYNGKDSYCEFLSESRFYYYIYRFNAKKFNFYSKLFDFYSNNV